MLYSSAKATTPLCFPGFDALDEAMPEELEVAEAASQFWTMHASSAS